MSAEPAPRTRIGHKEREQAVQALADHFTSGRLDGDEYSERVALAWEAKTAPDLGALFADLPEPRPAVLSPRPAAVQPYPAPLYPTQPYPSYPQPVRSPVIPAPRDVAAPWGRDPRTGLPYSDKNKIVAGVLQLFLPFGIGRFYSGHTGIAVAQLVLSVFGFGVIWCLVDGIVLLVGSPHDPYGRPMRT